MTILSIRRWIGLRGGGLQGALPLALGSRTHPDRDAAIALKNPASLLPKTLLNFACWGYMFACTKLEGTREMCNGKSLLFSTPA